MANWLPWAAGASSHDSSRNFAIAFLTFRPRCRWDPEGQRYRLFEAVAGMLAVASRARPMLLLFDDLHWADRPTLLLLRHVMRSARMAPFAIVATYRESELDRTHPLAEMLVALRRERGITRLALRGLKITHIKALVNSIVGPNAPSQLAQVVMDSTDGNPFFATEMLQHLKETGAIARVSGMTGRKMEIGDLGLSEGIKEVIGQRLSRLSEACNRLLSIASVIGREFDATLLEAIADLPENELLDAIEEATRAQLVSESQEVSGRFEFIHALIRETLYSELSSPRRVRLHQRVADAIEGLMQNMPNPPLAELAYHFSQAASAGAVDKAVDYATRAGDRAADGMAHEQAARLFDLALHSLELRPTGPETELRRVDLHTRRASSFGALGQWTLEVRELEAAVHHCQGAFASANNLLFLILAVMLATFMVSGFISRLSLAGLELDFLLPEHISARRKLLARIVIRNTKGWMPSFSIHVTASGDSGLSFPLYFPVIPGGARVEEPVELLFARRGSYRQNSFRFSTRFPFGFTERRINVPLLREVLIYPSIDPQPGFEDLLLSLEGEIASFYRGQGHDFYRIRPYEVLESARYVDWKATAHTGDLQVREFAREKEQAVAFFLDLDAPEDHAAWFETAVDRCAFLAWNMSQRGSRVRFARRMWIGSSPKRRTFIHSEISGAGLSQTGQTATSIQR